MTPSNITRKLRDLKHFNIYKANEFRNLCFFGWIALHQILNNVFFDHLILLVSAVHLLSSFNLTASPNNEKISKAKEYLIQFVEEYEKLYGTNFMSSNVHDLLHLPDCCARHGPLYEFSAFSYESLNSDFLRLANGPKKYEIQIAQNFQLYKYLYNNLVNEKIEDDAVANYISKSLFQEKKASNENKLR